MMSFKENASILLAGANELNHLTSGELKIETSDCYLSVSGGMRFGRDAEGLEHLKRLQSIISDLVEEMTSNPSLPEFILVDQPQEIENPFI